MGVSYILNNSNTYGGSDSPLLGPEASQEPHTIQHSSFPRTIPDMDLATVAEQSATHSSTRLDSVELLRHDDIDPPPYIDRAKMQRIYNMSSCDMDTMKAVVDGTRDVPMLRYGRTPPTPSNISSSTGSTPTAGVVDSRALGSSTVADGDDENDIDEDAADSYDPGFNPRVLVLGKGGLMFSTVSPSKLGMDEVESKTLGPYMLFAGCAIGAIVGSLITLGGIYMLGGVNQRHSV